MSYGDFWGGAADEYGSPSCEYCGGRLRLGTCPRCAVGDGFEFKAQPVRPCCPCGRLVLRHGDEVCPACDPSIKVRGRGRESVLYAEYLNYLKGDDPLPKDRKPVLEMKPALKGPRLKKTWIKEEY